jgi:hypothetical protein
MMNGDELLRRYRPPTFSAGNVDLQVWQLVLAVKELITALEYVSVGKVLVRCIDLIPRDLKWEFFCLGIRLGALPL